MRLPDDDEIYDVDQTYLGPPGRYIGRLRYRALAIGPLMILLGLAFLQRTGIGFNLLTVAITVMVAIRLTQWIVDKTNQERPFKVIVQVAAHEVTARRRPTKAWRTQSTRAFRRRTTKVENSPDLPVRLTRTELAEEAAIYGAMDGAVARRRWRSYENAAAASRKGITA